MRRFVLGFVPFALAWFASCAVEAPDTAPTEGAEWNDEPIISGTLDNTNNATVAVGENFGNQYGIFCSGTIIARNGSTGYALTAAHCVQGQNPNFIVVGADHDCASFGNCIATYDVTEATIHPNYDGSVDSPYDIAVLTFTGANANTPIVPAIDTADALVVGEQLELSGYGKTVTGEFNNDNNTQRRHVTIPVDELSSAQIAFDQSGPTHAGSCSGDSGGPAYKVFGGQKRVVGVTSFGDNDCDQLGVYVRVSWHYNNFIAPIIGAPVNETCDTCFQSSVGPGGSCEGAVNACFNNASCAALADCLNNCGDGDQGCINNCAAANQAGVDLFNEIYDCAICQACSNLCDTSECGMGSTSVTAAVTSSVTSTVVTSADATATAATGGTGGADGEGGAGATTSSGGGGGKKKKPTSTSESTVTCDCTVGAASSTDDTWRVVGLGAMAAAFFARRRRR